MDPKANLARQRELAEAIAIAVGFPDETNGIDCDHVVELAGELAELVGALDQWRMDGGFDPYLRTEGTPTPQQGIALANLLCNRRASSARVATGIFGLPIKYLHVVVDPMDDRRFECGIAPDGSVSS